MLRMELVDRCVGGISSEISIHISDGIVKSKNIGVKIYLQTC